MAVTANKYSPNLFPFFEAAAEKGERYAQWKVGCCYLEGRYVERDLEKAKYWLLKSSKRGLYLAQRTIAFMFLNGQGYRQSRSIAAWFFNKAAAQCDPVSQFELAKIMLEDTSLRRSDKSLAMRLLKEAHLNRLTDASIYRYFYLATGQIPPLCSKQETMRRFQLVSLTDNAEAYLGLYYFYNRFYSDASYGDNCLSSAAELGHVSAKVLLCNRKLASDNTKEATESASELNLLAKAGHREALEAMAIAFEFGKGCIVDQDLSLHIWQKSINRGYMPAMFSMAEKFLDEGNDISFYDFDYAMDLHHLSYRFGYQDSILYQGYVPLINSKFVDPSSQCGLALLHGAAEIGGIRPMMKLAFLYMTDQAIKDRDISLFWASAAADEFHLHGYGFLGNELTNPDEDQSRFAEGMAFLQIAHEMGDEIASYNLGRLFYWGSKSSIKNRRLAADYYDHAAKKGHKSAMHNLGCMLYEGDGVFQNVSLGRKLIEDAKCPPDESAPPNNVIRMKKRRNTK